MKLLILLTLLLVVTSCVSRPKRSVILKPSPAPAVEPIESVRYAEVVRPYHLGRYVDPNQPDVMHEQHSLYRVESTARWNQRPGLVTVPGLLNPPPDAAYASPPSTDAIAAELNRQKEATQRVMQEAAQLARSYTELQQVIKDMAVVARNHSWMGPRIVEAERRVKELELELRKLGASTSASSATNATNEVSSTTPTPPPDTLPVEPPKQPENNPTLPVR